MRLRFRPGLLYSRVDIRARAIHPHGLSFPRWITTDRQVADIFTKPLAQDLFYRFRSVLLNLSLVPD